MDLDKQFKVGAIIGNIMLGARYLSYVMIIANIAWLIVHAQIQPLLAVTGVIVITIFLFMENMFFRNAAKLFHYKLTMMCDASGADFDQVMQAERIEFNIISEEELQEMEKDNDNCNDNSNNNVSSI